MQVAARPFAKVAEAEIGFARFPDLTPANVRRDLSIRLPAKGGKNNNVVHSEPAVYDLQLLEIEFFDARKAGSAVKATFLVKASTPGALPAGTKACHLVWTNSDYFDREIKELLANAANVNPAQITEAMCEAAVSPGQPLTANNRHVRARVGEYAPTKSGSLFSRISFEPLEVQADGTLAAPAVNNVLT